MKRGIAPKRGGIPYAVGQRRGPVFSIPTWLEKPDLFVTRREFWAIIEHYDKARMKEMRENRWYRRLLRWLLRPIANRFLRVDPALEPRPEEAGVTTDPLLSAGA